MTAEAMQRITREHLEALARQHRRVHHVRYNGHDLVFRAVTRPEYARYKQLIQQDAPDVDVMLAQGTVVQVDGETDPPAVMAALNALLDEWPGMLGEKSVMAAMLQTMGGRQEIEEKGLGSVSAPNGTPRGHTPRG